MPDQKQLLLEIVKANPGGITASDIEAAFLAADGTGTRPAMNALLLELIDSGQVHRISPGKFSTTPNISTRFSVSLIPPVRDDLAQLIVWLGMNQTDVLNRGVALYKRVEEHRRAGYELVFRNPGTGHERIMEIL